MKKLLILSAISFICVELSAQTISNATGQVALAKPNNIIRFDMSQEGKATPIEWGLDTQWISEANLRRGINFSSKDIIDIMRLGFMPSASVSDGTLSEAQLSHINDRANLVTTYCKDDVVVNIADDPDSGNGVDSWYNDTGVSSTIRGERWAKCIDLHRQKYEALGLKVVSVSPFNEPDYGWNQGNGTSYLTRVEDFKNIAKALQNNYNGTYGKDAIRVCGCNTLNDDNASWWWNQCRDYLDEGNTHQLAGGFDSYANFYKEIREAGQHATADELHNVMEAMVGVEYGMQTGIWWGTATRTRGQFMKATHGNDGGARLAYAENRSAWTAASVYRLPDGRVEGFVGTSERQCQPDNYQFVSLDRDVYYNGQGPMREFQVSVPGGYDYQSGQTNAETVIDITSGEDVQPYIEGTYKIVNVNSGMVLAGTNSTSWTNVIQRKNSTHITNTNWVITPVPNDIGEDFAYYHIQMADETTLHWDIKNWNLDAGAKVGTFPGGGTSHIEQWYFEYAGNNNFYIKSRYSGLVVELTGSSTSVGSNIQMAEFTGEANQQWRLIPTDVVPEFNAPAAPTNLTATTRNASIRLDWTASESDDVRDYFVIRSEEGKDDFNTIGRYITGTSFTDNTAESGKRYEYAVKAEDTALNRSERSEIVSGQVTDEKGLVCWLDFEQSLNDTTDNGNHPALYGEEKYINRSKVGNYSLNMLDANHYLRLPSTIANRDEMTISFWLLRGTQDTTWERVFDFGNGTDQFLFFTPNSGDSKMKFEMRNGETVENITYQHDLPTREWNHFAISLDAGKGTATLYLNGAPVATNDNFTIRPTDFRPVMNYIGRSQYPADPYLKGYVDDFRIYNYALSDEEIAALFTEETGIEAINDNDDDNENSAIYDIQGRKLPTVQKGINIINGKKSIQK